MAADSLGFLPSIGISISFCPAAALRGFFAGLAAFAGAGAAALSKFGGYDSSLLWVSGDDDSGDAWQRVRLQAFVNSGGRIRL